MSEIQLQTRQPEEPSVAQMLQGVIQSGLTADNVQAFKELVQLHREEVASKHKAAFNRAFFALKKEISGMDFYCDKQATTKSGGVAYTYCSEAEIAGKLEPALFRHGFTMLFGQRQEADRVVAIVTLIHEDGHEETREYSVRVGVSNQMKDNTAVDAGSTTSAWRHLVMKMFGLKSRIREEDDARNIGRPISADKAADLERRCEAANVNQRAFLDFAGAKTFAEIGEARLPEIEAMLTRKEAKAKASRPSDNDGMADHDLDWNTEPKN